MRITRRNLLRAAALVGGACAWGRLSAATAWANVESNMAFGLCTYQWGKDWDLPTLIANLEQAEVRGVELRTTHAHKVEPALSDVERAQVRKQFEESRVELVGLGSDERFDHPDAAKLAAAIEATKRFLVLSHDLGGSGVKVKPDSFHEGVPREKTVAQIGKALNELGEYAEGYGQQLRLEVHGQCAELPTIAAILEHAPNPNVTVCWNSNAQDLTGAGLEHNFGLVQKRLGATVHVRELNDEAYPFAKLLGLLHAAEYSGWVLLESAKVPADIVAGLVQQRKLFDEMLAAAKAG